MLEMYLCLVVGLTVGAVFGSVLTLVLMTATGDIEELPEGVRRWIA